MYYIGQSYENVKEGDMVQFFGAHVLCWKKGYGCSSDPTMSFVQVSEQELRLIQNAPKMYEALIGMVGYVQKLIDSGMPVEIWEDEFNNSLKMGMIAVPKYAVDKALEAIADIEHKED